MSYSIVCTAVFQAAAKHVAEEGILGSATVCLLTVNSSNGMLHAANLGDAGFIVFGETLDHVSWVCRMGAQRGFGGYAGQWWGPGMKGCSMRPTSGIQYYLSFSFTKTVKQVKWVNQRRMFRGRGRGRGRYAGPGLAILVAYSWCTFGNGGFLSWENPLWRVMGEDEYFGGREWTQKGLSGRLMYAEPAAGAALCAQRSVGQEIS